MIYARAVRAGPRSAAIACLSALALAGCGGGGDESGDEAGATATTATAVPADRSGPQGTAPIPGTPKDPEKAAVVRAARAYVAAVNRRRAGALCALLAPGALAGLDPPRGRPDCRGAMRASIGYADPRGYPQWRRTKIELIKRVEVNGDRARVTMTVFHGFRDRRTISNEDDVVHFVKRRGRWRVAKASATLYRAVGKPEVPPEVLLAPSR